MNDKIVTIDMHGVSHSDASLLVEEWLLLCSYHTPAFVGKIITGNSVKMRTIVEGVLHKHKFSYRLLTDGTILVNDKL
jgi:hypothetical protein